MLWKDKGFNLAALNRHNNDFNIISENLKFNFINSYFIYQKDFYVVASSKVEDDKLNLEIVQVSYEGENKTIFTQSELLKMPFVDVVDDNLIFTTENYKKGEYSIQLKCINLDDMSLVKKGDIDEVEVHNIDNKTYKVKNDKYQGEVIVAIGGFGESASSNILYYQTMVLNKEDFEEGEGQPVIYKYNFNTGKIEEKLNCDIPVDFISGTNNIIIISEHAFKKPLENTGKMFLFDE